jgi:hypothetical protein
MKKVRLLIAGIPATGKSRFGKWLARAKGFEHIDIELCDREPDSWGYHGLRKEWNEFCGGSDRDKLPRTLEGRASSVVLNWGFPPNPLTLSCVSALKAGGVSLWWFDGDPDAARKQFELRARQRLHLSSLRPRRIAKELEFFDNQCNSILNYWSLIEPLFRGRIITTLRPDGTFMENEEIFSKIVGAADEADNI